MSNEIETSISTQEPKFWTARDCERLSHVDIEDAIDEFLDDLGPGPVERWLPETVTVYGFNPRKVDVSDFANGAVIESLLERLDEEYGDPEGDYTTPSADMHALERDFVAAVVARYETWSCEQVTTRVIELWPWVLKHRPELLYDHCVRCGWAYDNAGACMRRKDGCQGGRGENPHQHLRPLNEVAADG